MLSPIILPTSCFSKDPTKALRAYTENFVTEPQTHRQLYRYQEYNLTTVGARSSLTIYFGIVVIMTKNIDPTLQTVEAIRKTKPVLEIILNLNFDLIFSRDFSYGEFFWPSWRLVCMQYKNANSQLISKLKKVFFL